MPFIGIIAKENDTNFIKNKICENIINKFEVININKNSIENVKNIQFDILVINENINDFFKNSNYLENLIKKANYIIVNSDLKNNIQMLKNGNANIITYGFNAKSTVTISSVKEENIMICIQRKFLNHANIAIEEQEMRVKLEKGNVSKLYNILIIFIILTIFE